MLSPTMVAGRVKAKSQFPVPVSDREAIVRLSSRILIAFWFCVVLSRILALLAGYYTYKGMDTPAGILYALFVSIAFSCPPSLLGTWLQYTLVLGKDDSRVVKSEAHNVNTASVQPYRGIGKEVHAMGHDLNAVKGDIAVIKQVFPSIKNAFIATRVAFNFTNGTCASMQRDIDVIKEDVAAMTQGINALILVLSTNEINGTKTPTQTHHEVLQNPTTNMNNVELEDSEVVDNYMLISS